jgi:NADH:ubiquinone oxidoreductase subunit 6 (subunit J)
LLSASIFLLTLELEFLGLIYIMVYVGAILVLFLFVVLSFNLKDLIYYPETLSLKKSYLLFLFIYLFIFQTNSIYVLIDGLNAFDFMHYKNYFYFLQFELQDIHVFGFYLYTQLIPYLVLVGLILLVVMIGIIIITLENNPYKLQQNYKSRSLKTLLVYKK